MSKYTLAEISEALRYLKSRGWSLGVIHETVTVSGLTVVEVADKIRGGDVGCES